MVAERLAAIKDFAEAKPEAINAIVRKIIMGAHQISAVDAFDGFYRLAELTRAAEAQWSKMDMLLLPTTGTTYKIADVKAEPIRLNSNLGLYTNFVNLMDLSALAVPSGFRPDGLPFGVTLIGRAFEEPLLTRFGDRLHRSLPNAKLGAGDEALARSPALAPPRDVAKTLIQVAVVGAHLTGQPLNGQLVERQARLVRSAQTGSGYSFYALAKTSPAKPGLIFDGQGAGHIEVDVAAFGSFVALIPAPLGIGTVQLSDGSSVKGFMCEAHATNGALDITSFGGWRAWLGAQTAAQTSG